MNIHIKLHLRPHLAEFLHYLNYSERNSVIDSSFACTVNLHINSLFLHRSRFLQYRKQTNHFAANREVVVYSVKKQYLLSRRAKVFLPEHSQKIIEQFLQQQLLELLQTNISMWRDQRRNIKLTDENGKTQSAYLSKDTIIRSTLEAIGIGADIIDYENIRRQLNRYRQTVKSTRKKQFANVFEIPENDKISQISLFQKIKENR